jgi:hypothetical protein
MLESRSSAKQPADEAHVELSELAATEAVLLGVDAARASLKPKVNKGRHILA